MTKEEILILLYQLLEDTGTTLDSDDYGEGGTRVVDQEQLLCKIKELLEKDSGKKLNTFRMELR